MKRRGPERSAQGGIDGHVERTTLGVSSLRTATFVLIVGVALAACAFVKVPTLFYPRSDPDEAIYWQLAQNLAQDRPYSLQGTPLLADLSPGIYDHPLFHHPPLYAALLAPFARAGADRAAILVSWAGHLLAVLATALVARQAVTRRPEGGGFLSPAFWLPVVAVSADPLLLFVSRKLWIDAMLAGLVALSVAMLIVAEDSRRRTLLLTLSGALLGLAAMAKLSALIVAPIHLLAIFQHRAAWRSRLAWVAAVFVPAAAFVVPWCVLFYLRCGVFVPPWVKPDAWLIEHAPFVQVAVSRPWFYYVVKLPMLSPLVFVCAALLGVNPSLWRDGRVRIAVGWFVVVLVALTITSAGGYGFQMRHIAPLATAPYLIALVALADRERPGLTVACAFAVLIGTVTGAMFLLTPGVDEMLSLPEIARIITLP